MYLCSLSWRLRGSFEQARTHAPIIEALIFLRLILSLLFKKALDQPKKKGSFFPPNSTQILRIVVIFPPPFSAFKNNTKH